MEKFRTCENCCSYTFGVADTIIRQDIRSCTIKNGDKYFEESVSKSSMVSIGNRMFQQGKGNDVTLYGAKKESIQINENDIDAEYDAQNKKTYANKDYRQTFGKTLDDVFIYLVCDKTIKKSSKEKTQDGYVITLDLNPDLSTYFYKKQMYNVSNLDKLPVFSSVSLTYTLNKNLILEKMAVDEYYVATMFVDANIHATLESYYFSNEKIDMPTLDKKVTYRKR